MKNNKTTAAGIAIGLFLGVASMPTLQASDAVHWVEIPSKLCGGKTVCPGDREYQVVTKDGRVHKGQGLFFNPFGFATFANGAESFSADEVAEIRIRHRKPWMQAFAAPTMPMFKRMGSPACDVLCTLGLVYLAPVVMVVVDVPALPVTASVESIRRILPPRVIKVAP